MTSAPPSAAPQLDEPERRWTARLPRSIAAGLILAGLWVLAGGAARLFGADVVVTRLLSFVGIGPVQANTWSLPGVWTPLMLVLVAAVLTTVTCVVADRVAPNGRMFWALWCGAVLAGTVLGLCFDGIRAISYLQDFGVRGLSVPVVETAPVTTYWAVMSGWIPALLLGHDRVGTRRPVPARPALLSALVSIVLLIIGGGFADEARQQDIIRENAAQQSTTDDTGALIDPNAVGDPVAETAPGVDPPALDAEACTRDRATLILGTADGATGHRAQAIHLVNVSDQPCVIEGYPDIAFADQNGHALDVDVQPGSSFMATDEGSARITVPAQGQVTAVLGWDANSTEGALVARQLYAAPLPGLERGSWPVVLDITAGSTVEVTAWKLDPSAGAAP